MPSQLENNELAHRRRMKKYIRILHQATFQTCDEHHNWLRPYRNRRTVSSFVRDSHAWGRISTQKDSHRTRISSDTPSCHRNKGFKSSYLTRNKAQTSFLEKISSYPSCESENSSLHDSINLCLDDSGSLSPPNIQKYTREGVEASRLAEKSVAECSQFNRSMQNSQSFTIKSMADYDFTPCKISKSHQISKIINTKIKQ